MKIGQVQQAKSGAFYIKVSAGTKEGTAQSVTLNPGDVLYLQTPQEQIDFLVSSGKLTSAEAEARKAKIPEFIRYNVSLPSNLGGN